MGRHARNGSRRCPIGALTNYATRCYAALKALITVALDTPSCSAIRRVPSPWSLRRATLFCTAVACNIYDVINGVKSKPS